MQSTQANPDDEAQELVATYGMGARQQVVDRMIHAIREHDLCQAKRWERVAVAIDGQLASGVHRRRRAVGSADWSTI